MKPRRADGDLLCKASRALASGMELISVAGSFYFPLGKQPGNGRPLSAEAELTPARCSAPVPMGGLLFN